MNERIKELIDKSTETLTGFDYRFGNRTTTYFDKEKFAELIVRECASIIESQDVDPSFKNRMAWSIKNCFGLQ